MGELATLLMDDTLIQEVRRTTAGHWSHALNQEAYDAAARTVFEKACDAVAHKVAPSSEEAVQILRQWLEE